MRVRKRPLKKGGHVWEARWFEPHTGKTRAKSGFRTEREAKDFQAKMLAALGGGTYIDPGLGKTTLDAWAKRYLEVANSLRPSTRATYESMLRKHILPRLGTKQLSALSRLDVEAWASGLLAESVGIQTVRSSHIVLRRVLETAVRANVIGVNHARGIELPKPQSAEMRFLTPPEIERLASEVPQRYRALVLFLAYTGLRIGEAAALRMQNLDLLRGRVNVVEAYSIVKGEMILGPCKTKGSRRSVSLDRLLVKDLEAHLEEFPPAPNGLIFAGPNGAPLNRNNFRARVWHPACKRAGLEQPYPRIHDMRHTAVALAIAIGAHPKAIQSRAGHSSITMTLDQYGHLFAGQDEVLAARLGDLRQSGGGELVATWSRDNVVSINSQVTGG